MPDPLKILHVCKVFLPIKGGVQKVVSTLVEALGTQNHTILSTSNAGPSEDQPVDNLKVILKRSYVEVASLPIAPMLIPRYWKESRKADIIVVHYPFPLADFAAAFCPFFTPIIVHWHSDVVAQPKLKWLVAPFTYLLLLRSKSIVVTSERMAAASWWLKKFRKKVVLIPYGTQSIQFPSRKDIPFESFYLMVGRHVSYKGFDVAIKAMQFHDQNMVIIGHGPLLGKHQELSEALGVSDRIVFVTDATDEDIAGYMQHCLGFLFPSVMPNEAFGVVQIEAMSRRKPIINTALSSSVPWVARNGKEAITVNPGDVSALATAITELVDNPKLAEKLGSNGHLRYEELFTMSKFTLAIEDLYASIRND